MKRKAFTLLEVIISAVILAVAIVGITNVFLANDQWLFHIRARNTGGMLGNAFLDPLQQEVAQRSWIAGTTCLTGGACSGARAIDGITYTPAYAIFAWNPPAPATLVPPLALGRLQKVVLTITWIEPRF